MASVSQYVQCVMAPVTVWTVVTKPTAVSILRSTCVFTTKVCAFSSHTLPTRCYVWRGTCCHKVPVSLSCCTMLIRCYWCHPWCATDRQMTTNGVI